MGVSLTKSAFGSVDFYKINSDSSALFSPLLVQLICTSVDTSITGELPFFCTVVQMLRHSKILFFLFIILKFKNVHFYSPRIHLIDQK